MFTKDKILDTIYKSIDEINLQSENGNKLEKKEDTILYGMNSSLDSLGLVNLIVEVEQRFQDELDVTIDLTDEKALSQKSSPFLSVTTLSEYISGLINK